MKPLSKRLIKVDKPVKELPPAKRKSFDLTLGDVYYFASGKISVVECRLIEIYFEGSRKRISVDIDAPRQAGTLSLYPDEIGRTPEEALQNRIV